MKLNWMPSLLLFFAISKRNQVCDLIVSIDVIIYQMARDDFPLIMLNVANALKQIDDFEKGFDH